MRSDAVQVIAITFFLAIIFLGLTNLGMFKMILSYNEDVNEAKNSIQYDEQLAEKLHEEYDGNWNDIVKALN